MEVIVEPTKKRARTAKTYVPTRTYSTPAIPYEVSQPNRFWRIKKGLDPAAYWRKRYYRRRITGRGSYTSTGIGKMLGSQMGGFVGDKLENLAVSYITGLGSYSVNKNVFLSGNLPAIKNPTGPNSSGGTTIRYTEYLQDIITGQPNSFSSESFLINAGNSKTFPWLSQLAENYEQFEIEGMIFEFKSTSSDALNSTNTALGTVMLATQYDVLDPPFTSKQEMLNYQYASCVKPSQSVMHMIECDPRQTTVNELYTLASNDAEINVPSMSDARLYYLGRTTVATTGFQGTNVNVGQLHVTYQVRLLKPKLFATLGLSNAACDYLAVGDGSIQQWEDAQPFGFTTTILSSNYRYNNLGVIVRPSSIQIPNDSPKSYAIEVQWDGDTNGNMQTPTTTALNGTIVYQAIAPFNITTSLAHYSAIVKTNGNTDPFLLTYVTTALPQSGMGAASLRIRVYEINPDSALP